MDVVTVVTFTIAGGAEDFLDDCHNVLLVYFAVRAQGEINFTGCPWTCPVTLGVEVFDAHISCHLLRKPLDDPHIVVGLHEVVDERIHLFHTVEFLHHKRFGTDRIKNLNSEFPILLGKAVDGSVRTKGVLCCVMSVTDMDFVEGVHIVVCVGFSFYYKDTTFF